jgi:SAM-dependent methyltransferase
MPGQERREELLHRWRQALAQWTVPASIRGQGDGGSLSRRVSRRQITEERVAAPPGSRSFARAWEALPPAGTVLDVGSGAGGASLPLAARAGAIIGVDTDAAQLTVMAERARRLGVPASVIHGTWPDIAKDAPSADVVTCHHVLYGVHELEPFVAALTSHARRRVIVEIPERHPHWPLNPLWARFHGLRRPDGPTATDAAAALRALGLAPHVEVWVDESGWGEYEDFDELVERTRRRLYLPPARSGDIAEGLRELGVDPLTPRFPGTVGRRLVTIWWQGDAPPDQ